MRCALWQGMTSGSGSAVGDRRLSESGEGERRLLASGSGLGTRVTPGASFGGEGAVGGLRASGPTDNTRATPGDVARSTLGTGGGGDTGAATPVLTRTGEYGLLGLLARRTTLGVGAARSSATATSAAASAAFARGSSGSDAPTACA